MKPELFIFAGEKSGDLLGKNLLNALKKTLPGYTFSGVGGPEMRSLGMQCRLRMEEFEIMGFSETLRSLPKLFKQFHQVKTLILQSNPQAVIFIDYPGFNLRMAKTLRKYGYRGKIIQYVCPTIWAWGKGRKHHMSDTLDLLLTIYPFEEKLFSDTPLLVKYVGSPVKENILQYRYDNNWAKLLGIKNANHLIGIFPGSRKEEILHNFPYQLEAASRLKKEDPKLSFAISCAHEKIIPAVYQAMRSSTLQLNHDIFLVPKAYAYEMMRDCQGAMAKSGTVTLELALHKCPTVVSYKLTKLNRFIAKYILQLNLPYYCIVNILSEKEVFPELIAHGLKPKNLYKEIQNLLRDSESRNRCIQGCEDLHVELQEGQASTEAAQAIQELLS